MNLKSAWRQTKCSHLWPQFSALPSPFFCSSEVIQTTRQHGRVSKIIVLQIIFQKWLRHILSTCFPKSSFACITPFVAELPVEIKKKYVEIKYQLDATEVFIADLIACSTCFGNHYAHHQELNSIIQWLLPVVFRAATSYKPDT